VFFGRFPKPLRSISRGFYCPCFCVCAVEILVVYAACRRFQIDDLEMVGNGTFCRGMRDLNSRSMSGNDDWFGFPESELRSFTLCRTVFRFRSSSLRRFEQ